MISEIFLSIFGFNNLTFIKGLHNLIIMWKWRMTEDAFQYIDYLDGL